MEKSLNVMKCVLVKETELKYTTKSHLVILLLMCFLNMV